MIRRIDDVTPRELWAAIAAEQLTSGLPVRGARHEAIAGRLDTRHGMVDRQDLTIRLAVLVAQGLLVCPEPAEVLWRPTPAGERHAADLTARPLADSEVWTALGTEHPEWLGDRRPDYMRFPVRVVARRVGARYPLVEVWCAAQAKAGRLGSATDGGWMIRQAGVKAMIAGLGVPA